MKKAQGSQKRHADRRRREADLKVDQYVLLSTKNLRLPSYTCTKLKPRFIGPFKIVHVRGTAITLALPPELRVHPTFHSSLVRPYKGPIDSVCAVQVPLVEPSDEEYEVQEIMRHRRVRGRFQYLIRWRNYDASSDSWEPEENLENAQQILLSYKK